MCSVDRVKVLCRERGVAVSKLEKDLGFGNGYIAQLRKGVFPADRLKKIADYFGVTFDWLLSGGSDVPPTSQFDSRRESDEYYPLSPQEKQIIDMYRELDERGRVRLIQHALNAYDAELQRMKEGGQE